VPGRTNRKKFADPLHDRQKQNFNRVQIHTFSTSPQRRFVFPVAPRPFLFNGSRREAILINRPGAPLNLRRFLNFSRAPFRRPLKKPVSAKETETGSQLKSTLGVNEARQLAFGARWRKK
jgi:hypothetical protein